MTYHVIHAHLIQLPTHTCPSFTATHKREIKYNIFLRTLHLIMAQRVGLNKKMACTFGKNDFYILPPYLQNADTHFIHFYYAVNILRLLIFYTHANPIPC